jgi:hypothetical protein
MLYRAFISVCVGLSLASCAGTPATRDTPKSPLAAEAAAKKAPECPKPPEATRATAALNCTGPESVYTKTDIDRTGEATVGGALQNLSTTLTVHGNR